MKYEITCYAVPFWPDNTQEQNKDDLSLSFELTIENSNPVQALIDILETHPEVTDFYTD